MSSSEKIVNGNGEETFVKDVTADIDEQIPPPTAETFKQKMAVWIVRLIVAAMIPTSVGTASFALQYADRQTENQRKRTQVELRQKKLQLQLLSQIIDVAKKADFKNPTSLYRLGLIAHMVNENHDVFGIELQDAEQTMKLMFARLAPISGLRKRLAEAAVVITNVKERAETSQKNEDLLEEKINELKKVYMHAPNQWARKRIDRQIAEKKQELAIQRDRRRFFAAQLYREKQLQEYFQDQLDRQARNLKTALQEASALRDRLKLETTELWRLIKEVERLSPDAKSIATKMRAAVRHVRENHQKAEQLVKQMQTELTSEREEAKDLRYRLARCQLERKKPCPVWKAPAKVPFSRQRKAPIQKWAKPRPTSSPMRPPRLQREPRILKGLLKR